MSAYGFIIGYVSLWLAWSSLVAAVSERRAQRLASLGLRESLSILGCALVPIVVLSLLSYYTSCIAKPVNEMLSLMTPILLALFVTNQLARRGIWRRHEHEWPAASGEDARLVKAKPERRRGHSTRSR